MPTGRLVAADGACFLGAEPFTVSAAPGVYPVTVATVRWAEPEEDIRVAGIRVLIGRAPVATWELALRPGEDPRLLNEGEYYGFGIDTGIGCFVDAAAAPGIAEVMETQHSLVEIPDGGLGEIVDPHSGGNMLAYDSGWGDGHYPTWIGRSAAGEVVCFISDMRLSETF
jgi:hypothetical protein